MTLLYPRILFSTSLFKVSVNLAPLHPFTIRSCLKIGQHVTDNTGRVGSPDFHIATPKILKEDLSMLFLITGCFGEDIGYLFVAFLLGLAGKECLPIPRV
jgi:hypothetical protein